MVTVYKLSTIQDMNEVMAHQLELVVTRLRIKKQQQMAASVAHAVPPIIQSDLKHNKSDRKSDQFSFKI